MIYFVSGIDTDTGKSIITGLLARYEKKEFGWLPKSLYRLVVPGSLKIF